MILSLLMVMGVIVSFAPIIYMILLSFLPQRVYINTNISFTDLINSLTFENFKISYFQMQFSNRIMESLRLTGLVILIVVSLGIPAAHAISRLSEKMSSKLALTFLSFKLLPGIAVCIPIFWIFNRSGLIPSWLSLAFVQIGFNLPIFIWLTIPIFCAVPKELEDMAYLDGLPHIGVLLGVVFPLTYRRLIGVVLIISILVWNESFFASIFRVNTVTEMIPSLITQRGIQWGIVMAIGSMVTIPSLIVLAGILQWRWGLEYIGE